MKRRDFLASAVGAGILSAVQSGKAVSKTLQTAKSQYIELIRYRMLVGPKKNRLMDFYKQAAIPALNRIGIRSVGVFTIKYGTNDPTLIVLIPHDTLESVVSTPSRLLEDPDYMLAGTGVVDASLSDPAYARIESSLLVAFQNMPKVDVPISLLSNNSRIYELRTYESTSQTVGKKKIQMFNEGGEIDIFHRTGLRPVFFGETLIGSPMPSLSYMLVFENMEERDKNWAVFSKDPEWVKLRADLRYTDLVSNINDIILSPAAFSQI